VKRGPTTRGEQGGKEGRLIEKNGGSGRCSPTKVDDGAIRAKSRAGQNPPVASSG
jgi:hypothetical protein